MSSEKIPPAIQEQLVRIQQLQQTFQTVVAQKQQLEAELLGVEQALEELEKLSEEAIVYKAVGPLLIKVSRNVMIAELKERKDLLDMRISVLSKQEERTREKLIEAQRKLQGQIQGLT
ncbi:MAG: prefoldin subunit beta [Nitrososphaerota archaeon]|nr:prefoldin subunit beta [Candidatus Bathyarchaeota archaeon]MDW8061825.1 prefoldin subunit beta [Nitrososphaerota archaeon]